MLFDPSTLGFKLDWGETDFKLLGLHFSVDLTKIPDSVAIYKIISIIRLWKSRNVTPIGKIITF